MRLTYLKTFLLIGALLCGGLQLSASIIGTATFTDTMPSAGTWDYDITLNNTGTTTIGTFWFSWIPGAGFMTVPPTNVQSPAGWNEMLTNSNMSIQWTTTTSLLAPGASVTGFKFDSTLSPAQLQAPFAGTGLGSGDPTSTAFVYIAAPLADPGAQLNVTPAATSATPEPSAGLLSSLGITALLLLKFARRRRGGSSV